jgi:WD40 repeat protein
MNARCLLPVSLVLCLSGVAALAQKPDPRPVEKEVVLRVDADGPTALVTALAFAPDGQTLYSTGFDKLVRSWALDKDKSQFGPGGNSYRVPIGPGPDGVIAALALSPDGKRLAVAGTGRVSGRASFGQPGQVMPKVGGLTDAMRLEQGTISVFDTDKGTVQPLRGHQGVVLALAFAPPRQGKPPLLASVGPEWDGEKDVGSVRLWDAASGQQLESWSGFPLSPRGPYGLALWHTGDKPGQVRVAMACRDGKLRLWEPGRDPGKPPEATDAAWNSMVAWLPGSEQVLTGSFDDESKRGQLRLWDAPSGQRPQPARQPIRLEVGYYPRALTLFAARPDGNSDHAAVISVSQAPSEGNKYRLHVFDLKENFGQEKARVDLWQGGTYLPVVAVDPGGRFLAVSGHPNHQVLVFSIADLLKKGNAAKQRQALGSSGATLRYVSFVKKGADRGLVLSAAAAAAPGKPPAELATNGLVFDFTQGKLTAYRKSEWAGAAAELGNWQVRTQDKPRPLVLVERDGKQVGRVELSKDQEWESLALLPPGPSSPFPVPILALAYHEAGEVILALYNAASGEQLRQFTGHVNPVRSLAFAADGKLLASAAEDQTVCVWSLADLGQHLGQHGQLRGWAVQEKGGDLMVAPWNDEELSSKSRQELKAKGVRKDDVIEGLVEKGQPRRLAAPRDFYNAVWLLKPGQPLVLRVKGRGDVALVADQGIDERKPLLSLFVTQGDKPEVRQWVGWNPAGPYDFGGQDSERLLGWHKNTGQAEQPVAYALAGEYRKLHHKPKILTYLIAHGNTGAALEAWKEDHRQQHEPQMTLWLREAGPAPPADSRGRALVRQLPRTLVLSLHELHPDTRVSSVKWQLNGTAMGELKQTTDREWTADAAQLAKISWERRDYTVRVELTTEAPEVWTYPRELAFRYQPLPPAVRLAGDHPLVVKDNSRYTLKAEVVPGSEEGGLVKLLRNGKDTGQQWELRKAGTVETVVTLAEEHNVLQLVAHNKGQAAEKETLTLEVRYQATAPEIALSRIVLPSGKEIRIADQPAGPIGVDAAKVRIVGTMEALTDLIKPAWAPAEGSAEQPFPLGDVKTKLTFDQEVTLKPKVPQKIRFAAETKGSKRVERSVVVEYRPRLPELALSSPAEGQKVYAGKVTLQGQLFWPPDRVPCQASLVVNDKEQAGGSRAIQAKEETVTAEVSLQPGENWVQVKLKNEWYEALTPRVRVSYLRPPRLVDQVKESKKGTRSFVDLSGRAASAPDLPVTRLEVNGRELGAQAVQLKQVGPRELGGGLTEWEFRAVNVPVQKGPNRVTLRAGNRDGWSEPVTHAFEITDKDLPRARVQFLDPQRDLAVEDAAYTVRLSVQSESPLTKVELLRNGEVVFRLGEAELKGGQDVQKEHKVTLRPGSNSLKVVAHNDGGEQATAPVVLTYNDRPARVVIDKLELPNGQEVLRQPGVAADGGLTFAAAEQSSVRVYGRVICDRDPQQLARLSEVRLYVNGQQQSPVELSGPGGANGAKTFQAEVRLTRPADNEIEVKLPAAVMHEAGSRRKCRLDCRKPAPLLRHQPHLLLIDAGNVDRKKLVQRHLDLLGAKPKDDGRFTLDGYAKEGIIWGPLTGALVTKEKVNALLFSIDQTLRLNAREGAVNDVVFVYLRAGETITADQHFFYAPAGARATGSGAAGINCERLQKFFEDSVGRGVLFLDVTRLGSAPPAQALSADRVAQWPLDPHVAVFRTTWWDQPDKQAEDTRLAAYLAEALGKAGKLQDVAAHLAAQFQKEPPRGSLDPKYKDRLTLDQQVPFGLRDFPLGRPGP